MFSPGYVLNSLSLFKLRTEGQTRKQKTSLKSCKTKIKILANPGFAQSDFQIVRHPQLYIENIV